MPCGLDVITLRKSVLPPKSVLNCRNLNEQTFLIYWRSLVEKAFSIYLETALPDDDEVLHSKCVLTLEQASEHSVRHQQCE